MRGSSLTTVEDFGEEGNSF